MCQGTSGWTYTHSSLEFQLDSSGWRQTFFCSQFFILTQPYPLSHLLSSVTWCYTILHAVLVISLLWYKPPPNLVSESRNLSTLFSYCTLWARIWLSTSCVFHGSWVVTFSWWMVVLQDVRWLHSHACYCQLERSLAHLELLYTVPLAGSLEFLYGHRGLQEQNALRDGKC